jgi:hypothetical protein
VLDCLERSGGRGCHLPAHRWVPLAKGVERGKGVETGRECTAGGLGGRPRAPVAAARSPRHDAIRRSPKLKRSASAALFPRGAGFVKCPSATK